MVGERLINEIINEKKIYSPKEVLTELNFRVRKALKQDQNDNRDGMDVCLCRIERNNNNSYEICYAGAKRDLYIYKNSENIVETIKGTRKTIGGVISRNKNVFIETKTVASKNDVIYLTSDGFIDQNNNNRQRLGTKKLIKLFNDIGKNKLVSQKEILEKTLQQHTETQKQRDDITVIGVLL